MKRNIVQLAFGFVLTIVIGLSLPGCGAADAVTPNCTTTSDYCDSGKDLETCCTSAKCYYKWNGNRYDCSGTDCNSAAAAVVDDACSFGTEDVQVLVKLSADLVKQAGN